MTETPEGRHLRVAVLTRLLGIGPIEADTLLDMANDPGHDNLNAWGPTCGASFAVGTGPATFCTLPSGHRAEHDWAWLLSRP